MGTLQRVRDNDESQDGKRKRIEECMHSPSESVDKVWHALLLFPGVYYRLCSQLLGNGEFIDHAPRAAGNSYCDKAARYTFTLQCYIKVFVCGLTRCLLALATHMGHRSRVVPLAVTKP